MKRVKTRHRHDPRGRRDRRHRTRPLRGSSSVRGSWVMTVYKSHAINYPPINTVQLLMAQSLSARFSHVNAKLSI